jgi:hypothetical protein
VNGHVSVPPDQFGVVAKQSPNYAVQGLASVSCEVITELLTRASVMLGLAIYAERFRSHRIDLVLRHAHPWCGAAQRVYGEVLWFYAHHC